MIFVCEMKSCDHSPRCEQVVGKAGRADTPTDPSGLDMLETIITLRDGDLWPKRKVQYSDVQAEERRLIAILQGKGYLKKDLSTDQLDSLINSAAMDGVFTFDRSMRDLARRRELEYQPILAHQLTAATINDLLEKFRSEGRIKREPTTAEIEQILAPLAKEHGIPLIELPRQEEMDALLTAAVDKMVELKIVDASPDLLLPARSTLGDIRNALAAAVGGQKRSFFGDEFTRFTKRLHAAELEHVKTLNWELEDYAPGALDRTLLFALREHATGYLLLDKAPLDDDLAAIAGQRQAHFGKGLFLWHKTKADIVKEMDSELQMPGWANIWTQPIINRVDMLATGVRTMIGVKVFGTHQEDLTETVTENGRERTVIKERGIQTVSNEIAAALRDVRGAVDVFPDQIVGRSYVDVQIDREKAARYGVNVSDVEDAVEIAMGGKTATTTVEQRDRFPVRVRYARDFWQTFEALRRTLVTGQRGATAESAQGGQTYQVPITDVAEIKKVEGASVIKSENGMLRSYVQLNVRDRDIVGFVEEAQRVVAAKVKLPPGFYIEWSGQFESQVRARQTLSIIFPLVILLIFVILFLTFNSWRDALLIILTVPGRWWAG